MALDIDALKLTFDDDVSDTHLVGYRAIADAQLAKALWGLSDWLLRPEGKHYHEAVWAKSHELSDTLQGAGIHRPTAAPNTDR